MLEVRRNRPPSKFIIKINFFLAKWKPKEVTLVDMFRSIMVAIEIAMMEPKTQVGGVNVIIDLEGLSLTHVYQFSPSMAKLIVDWVQVR